MLVGTRGKLVAFSTADGRQIWDEEVQWALPAGEVVIVRLRPNNPDAVPTPNVGFTVLLSQDGRSVWTDPAAQAVWAFANGIVDLTCPEAGQCRLRGRGYASPESVIWAVGVSDAFRGVHGPNPAMAGTRSPAEWFAGAAVGEPAAMPLLFGFTIEGKFYLVDPYTEQVPGAVAAGQPHPVGRGQRPVPVRAGPARPGRLHLQGGGVRLPHRHAELGTPRLQPRHGLRRRL